MSVPINKPRYIQAPAQMGFTILEILIAVIIIGVLTLILVPVLTNRIDDARKAACERDMEEIANAQTRIGVQLGYYVRLYALDDVAGGDGDALGVAGDRDGIGDEALNTGFFDSPTQMFINTNTHEFVSRSQADSLYNAIRYETSYNWTGPYYNIHRDETPDEHNDSTSPPHLHDIPNDPWGNDYLFFVRGGLVREPEGDIVDTVVISGSSYAADIFDRPTILSMGPDGLPGSAAGDDFGEGDDMYRQFEY